jgi:UPF0755 protein
MKKRKILAAFIITFAVMLSSVSFYTYQIVNVPNILVEGEDMYLFIPRNATFRSVQDSLFDKGIVKDPISFSFLAKLMNYDKQVKPGRYLLRREMNNLSAIRYLRAGIQDPVDITFNNVRLLPELAKKICRNIEITPDEFLPALNDFVENNHEGFTDRNVMAMFIPNTYEVYWSITATDLVGRMHAEYLNFWNEERIQKAREIELTPIEVSILASIIQAEQLVHPDERPVIAGLYHNRLKINMKLDSDPTLIFATGDFSIKRVLNIHKEIDSPYNTYKLGGLPPGPINMPDINSIDAVLNFSKHNYLFMVAREDFSGYHRFATNIRDHINNANRYQRQLSIEQRKARMQNSN